MNKILVYSSMCHDSCNKGMKAKDCVFQVLDSMFLPLKIILQTPSKQYWGKANKS